MPASRHAIFRTLWWSSNLLLAPAFVALIYSCVREHSLRRYLDGFSDAIVPDGLPAEQKVNAIFSWMRAEPRRAILASPDSLVRRDPQIPLNYQQLRRLRIPRFHLREHAVRAGAAFLSAPEIKE